MKTIREKQEKEKNHQIKKGATLLILLFFAMVMLFQRESQTAEMIFVRNSEEVPLHGSAQQQRDYLFADEGATQSIPQGTI